jgi:hypothetical protein
MKAAVVTLIVLVLSVQAAFVGSAQDKYVPRDDEEFYGTWINKNNPSVQKIAVFAGGYKEYSRVADAEPVRELTVELTSKWRDADGNVWYKALTSVTSGADKGVIRQELYEVSDSGKTWQIAFYPVFNYDPDNYPKELNPKSLLYRILYRTGN